MELRKNEKRKKGSENEREKNRKKLRINEKSIKGTGNEGGKKKENVKERKNKKVNLE